MIWRVITVQTIHLRCRRRERRGGAGPRLPEESQRGWDGKTSTSERKSHLTDVCSSPQSAAAWPRAPPAAPSSAWTWPTSPVCWRTASDSRRAPSCRWGSAQHLSRWQELWIRWNYINVWRVTIDQRINEDKLPNVSSAALSQAPFSDRL